MSVQSFLLLYVEKYHISKKAVAAMAGVETKDIERLLLNTQ
ncbi:HTH domain-containing protein [Schaedlerella arabinosiphila]